MKMLIAAATVGALTACASTQPFSYIDGNRYTRAEMNAYSVIVLDVDGRSDLNNPVKVSPGRHVLRVQAPPGRGFSVGQVRALDLDVKPCVRYYLKAVKQSPLDQDFTPVVDFEERIGGCPA